MPEASFPVEVINGVPVVTAPEEIDITKCRRVAGGPARSSRAGERDAGGRHGPDTVLRLGRA